MKIRPIAICLLHHQGRIFVLQGFDPVKESYFYRPLGGGIDFGETGAETVVREFREETGHEVTDIRYLTTLENIFTYKGRQAHEIVLLYAGRFVDESLYQRQEVLCQEDSGKPFRALWVPLQDFRSGHKRLVPEDLLPWLEQNN